MTRTKVFAAYLPQYHETEDNNRFWGKGYTDWVAVRKALPQYEGHIQPKIPLNENYYDLSDIQAIRYQAQLARKYGIDGFNIYHYWFKNGKQELEKPAELILSNPDIDIEYFFTWDSGSWKRTWSNVPGNDWAPNFDQQTPVTTGEAILVEGGYEDRDAWLRHFRYLLKFFRDKRYLKIDNKPVLFFMDTGSFDELSKMYKCWDEEARNNGFGGVYLASRSRVMFNKTAFNRSFYYEPEYSAWGKRRAIETRITKLTGITFKSKCPVRYIYDYDLVWRRILKREAKRRDNMIPGCFVSYDDTPRRGKKAMIIQGGTPDKFYQYFKELYSLACRNDRELLLLTAWNEWGEGAYLEPDSITKFEYLEAIGRVLREKKRD